MTELIPPIISFDIFETLVVRSVWPPRSVYALVANEICSILGRDLDVGAFAHQRWEAELRAFAIEGASYTLDRIYQHMQFEPVSDIPVELLVKVEANIEERIARPITVNVERVSRYRSAGGRVIFVSDTYLGMPTILAILDRVGVRAASSDVFLSNEYGCFKNKGLLFRAIVKQTGVAVRNGLHIGNSLTADVRGAKKADMDSEHFKEGNPNEIENRLESICNSYDLATARLAGFYRVKRLSAPRQPFPCRQIWRESLVSLAIICFLCWIVKESRARGVQRIILLARDCYLLHCVVDSAEFKQMTPDLEFSYLYASRSVWLDDRPESKQALADYLSQEGVFRQDISKVIVDVGWRGSLHACLCECMHEQGLNPLNGFFLGLDDCDALPHASLRISLLRPVDAPARVAGRIDPNIKFFIESIFQAPHGTLTRFERRGDLVVPVFESRELLSSSDLSGAIVLARQFFTQYPMVLGDESLHRSLVKLLIDVSTKPSECEAEYWGGTMVETELHEGHRSVALASPIKLIDLISIVHGRRFLSVHEKEWVAGRVARSGMLSRLLLSALGF